MNSIKEIRDVLEPETPRLSADAASRIEATVEHTLSNSQGKRRLRQRPGLFVPAIAVPALVLIITLILINPFGRGEISPKILLLNEEQLMANLEQMIGTDVDVEGIYYGDDVEFVSDNWTDDDWNAFTENLEDFQLSDTGGNR
ncbi:MAG: hypothetical protein GY835_26440 [bacterium]|nr:hypothetical protein [bacterium]